MKNNEKEITEEAKRALCDIIDYIEAEEDYKHNAQLIIYIERAIKSCN